MGPHYGTEWEHRSEIDQKGASINIDRMAICHLLKDIAVCYSLERPHPFQSVGVPVLLKKVKDQIKPEEPFYHLVQSNLRVISRLVECNAIDNEYLSNDMLTKTPM